MLVTVVCSFVLAVCGWMLKDFDAPCKLASAAAALLFSCFSIFTKMSAEWLTT